MGERTFPVLKQMTRAVMPPSVPWAFAESFRVQAERNHGQTLERLAERGGLCPEEMWLAAHGQPFSGRHPGEAACIDWLGSALDVFYTARKEAGGGE